MRSFTHRRALAVALSAAALGLGVPAAIAAPGPAATPKAAAAKPIYRAIGDSYAAGYALSGSEGCARSPKAYPELLSHTTLKTWRLQFQACSGATTAQMIKSQLGPRDPRVRLVTVSAGGNDVGFGAIATCTPNVAACEAAIANGLALEKSGAITRNVHALLLAIHAKLPNAKIDLLDYPIAIQHTQSQAGCSATIQAAVQLLGAQLDQLNVGLNTAIHAAVTQVQASNRAKTTNIHVAEVRSVVGAFTGHGMCSKTNWIGRPGSTSPLHPTARGQVALAAAVRRLL